MKTMSIETSNEVENLLYRRQFILSTDPTHALPNSQEVLVAGQYHLSAHRDLELTHVESNGKSLTLLGFALDPDQPDATNEQILTRLMAGITRCESIFSKIDALGGRWVLIIHDGAETTILNDATAQRQVYFTRTITSGAMVCASKPGVMADRLGLEMDADAVDFIHSRKVDDYEVYWMPGDTSLYADISVLLPNHCLSLSDRTSRRFWPIESLATIDYQTALFECVRLLRGQVESAHRRYSLAISMTAGWDSRLMLALSREYASDLYAFTLAYPHLSTDSRDVYIPARLLKTLGITHHVIPYPQAIDNTFKDIFRRNNSSASAAYCADTQALHASYPGNRICVTGDVAEIVKCYYKRTRPSSEPISAIELTELGKLGIHSFAVKAFGDWLEKAGKPPIDTLDLFCWEQMAGRWQSKIRAEYDMAQDSFAPLNNRRLLGIMMGVDAAFRRAPNFKFFADLIDALWPEVLCEPINPPERKSRSQRLMATLQKTGLLQLVPKSAKERVKAMFH